MLNIWFIFVLVGNSAHKEGETKDGQEEAERKGKMSVRVGRDAHAEQRNFSSLKEQVLS